MRTLLHSIALALALALAACAARGPVLSDDLLARIEPGMTREDVRAIAGPPHETMAFPLSRTESWSWFYWDTWGYYCEFSATFAADGRLAGKLSRRVNDGGDFGT